MVAAQLFTLAGVALGAVASYLVGSLNERARHQREVAKGWEERKYESFVAFTEDIKMMSHICRRMAAALGLHDRMPKADELGIEEGSPLVAEADQRRTVSLERLRLLSDSATISAAYQLNEAVWALEWIVQGRIPEAGCERSFRPLRRTGRSLALSPKQTMRSAPRSYLSASAASPLFARRSQISSQLYPGT